MKKWLLLFALLLIPQVAFCDEILQVESLTEFSTADYPEFVKLRALNDLKLSSDVTIKAGYVLTGKLTEVSSPKRLKRNAKFSFMPLSYVDNSGSLIEIKEPFEGKYSAKLEIDKGQIAKSAALGVGNYFVKGISMGYYAVEGAVKNESDNRFKSSAKSVYENSPFAYVEKGQDIEIKVSDIFGLKFKVDEEDDTAVEVVPD